MTPIQYNWNVPLDRFMMNADIKLFLMGLDFTKFDELNVKDLHTCFEYTASKDTKFECGGKFRNRATMIDC